MDDITNNPNIIAAAISAVITVIIGYFVHLVTKQHDARAEAEAALIGTGPRIIELQNIRIKDLEVTLNAFAQQLNVLLAAKMQLEESQQKLKQRIAFLEQALIESRSREKPL